MAEQEALQDVDNNVEQPTEEVEASATETAEETPTEQPTGQVDGVQVEGPDGFKKAINKKHFQLKEAERKAEKLEKRLQELEAKQAESNVVEGPVEVPPMPDEFDENFKAKAQEREAAIAQNARYSAQQELNQKLEAERQETLRKQEEERTGQLINTFSDNITKLGLDAKKVEEAANVLVQYGADADTAEFVMTDDDGPLVAQYFANDLNAFDEFMSLSPMARGMRISEVKEKAQAFKPRTSEAPPPPTAVGGKTAPAQRGPAGATFT